MKCQTCGTENVNGAAFCKNCGAKLAAESEQKSMQAGSQKSYQNQNYQNTQPNQGYNQYGGASNQFQIPEEYKPISMWGYFGYEILFSIPIVGLILLIVFAITAKNVNLKNFARSYFCFLIILLIIVGIIIAVAGGLAAFLGGSGVSYMM